ncbi:MAG: DNA-deoxyinosine glycosylase [Bacilli bacterium]|nr:DNA-deoxyinosine glycosylase [Bacilli bacterium]
MKIIHPLEPIYDKDSKVLILGSMPSVKSREVGFYYGHPQNRFWKTLGKVYNENIGESKESKIEFLKRHHIALFDVLKSCEIEGSKDQSIKNPQPNNLLPILKNSSIQTIFTTGKKADQLYQKYCYPKTKIKAICLPSTSPCNCPKGIEEKLEMEYQKIRLFSEDSE